MIKNLKTLCLSVLFPHFCSAANLSFKEEFETLTAQATHPFSISAPSTDDQLKTLKTRAKKYYKKGQRELEGLTRVKILAINPTRKTLRLALQSCVINQEFTVGETLLETYRSYVSKSDFIELRNYLQDEAVRVDQEKFNASPKKTKNFIERFVYRRKVSMRPEKARSSVRSLLSVLH